MTHDDFLKWLQEQNACRPAQDWVEKNKYTPAGAWANCNRADWMLWFAVRWGLDRVQIVRAACTIARTVLHLIPDKEDRPLRAIEAAEAWCLDATDLHAYAAARAADAAYAAYAADAAYAAAYVAAYAASAAARAAARAVRAADDASAARAAALAVRAADDATQRQYAQIVRGIVTGAPQASAH